MLTLALEYATPEVMFRDQLRDLVESTPGAVAAVLMGFDGIGVDQYAMPTQSIDTTTASMELSFVFAQLKKLAQELQLGDTKELQISTDRGHWLLRVLSKDYFVALVMEGSKALVGQGRYMLRVRGAKMQEEL